MFAISFVIVFSKASVEIFIINRNISHHLLESQRIESRYKGNLTYKFWCYIMFFKISSDMMTHHNTIDLVSMHTTSYDEMFAWYSTLILIVRYSTIDIFILKDYFFEIHDWRQYAKLLYKFFDSL